MKIEDFTRRLIRPTGLPDGHDREAVAHAITTLYDVYREEPEGNVRGDGQRMGALRVIFSQYLKGEGPLV
jgi:hypothetical protein